MFPHWIDILYFLYSFRECCKEVFKPKVTESAQESSSSVWLVYWVSWILYQLVFGSTETTFHLAAVRCIVFYCSFFRFRSFWCEFVWSKKAAILEQAEKLDFSLLKSSFQPHIRSEKEKDTVVLLPTPQKIIKEGIVYLILNSSAASLKKSTFEKQKLKSKEYVISYIVKQPTSENELKMNWIQKGFPIKIFSIPEETFTKFLAERSTAFPIVTPVRKEKYYAMASTILTEPPAELHDFVGSMM